MREATRKQLLDINRTFYVSVAEPFDATRRVWPPGKRLLLDSMPLSRGDTPPSLLDVGCGNGRLALMLESRKVPWTYVGVDGSAELLALARQHTSHLSYVQTSFHRTELADEHWELVLGDAPPAYDVITCLATLQHLPGFDMRLRVMRTLATLLTAHGMLAISAWQFLDSPRLAGRQLAWEGFHIDPDDVEPGDALLPWQQGRHAARYVHQIGPQEMAQLAAEAGLVIRESYRADGREGNLNLYTILHHQAGKSENSHGSN